MKKIILLLFLSLTSCITKKTLAGYDFSKIGSSEEFLYGNVPYNPTAGEQEYFESVMDVLVNSYDLKVKDYTFQYFFSKNTFGDTEVYALVYPNRGDLTYDPEEIYRTSHCSGTYYALVNATRDRAYFIEDFSPQDPFGHAESKGYFYLQGKTREVENDLGYIFEPTVWRDFDFEDWARLSIDGE